MSISSTVYRMVPFLLPRVAAVHPAIGIGLAVAPLVVKLLSRTAASSNVSSAQRRRAAISPPVRLSSGLCATCNDQVYSTTGPLAFPIRCANCRRPAVVLDGSNIAHWNSPDFQLETVLTLCLALRRKRRDFVCFFDRSAWRHVGAKYGEAVQAAFCELLNGSKSFVRSGYADPDILRTARGTRSLIVSDDQFNTPSLRKRFPFLNDTKQRHRRVVRGVIVRGRLLVHALDIEVKIETDVAKALALMLKD